METCQRICLTPTKNESWIIKTFARAARQWATQVIIADQGSSDGTQEIARSVSGVQVVANDSKAYDEAYRQRLLIQQARQHTGKRILIALDSDEALSANFLSSKDWHKINSAEPGTVLRFKWVNILPGFEKAWIPPEPTAFGFVDDGTEHSGEQIHSRRIPWPVGAQVIDLEDIVVLHFQYVVWERMLSKHRWYQAWERMNNPGKSPLQIFRQYHHMNGSWDPSEIHAVKPEWLAAYDQAGIDFRSLKCEEATWWDTEILQMLETHGPRFFRKIAIWDVDWNAGARKLKTGSSLAFSDPRSPFEKTIHALLTMTQNRRSNWAVSGMERALRLLGW